MVNLGKHVYKERRNMEGGRRGRQSRPPCSALEEGPVQGAAGAGKARKEDPMSGSR